MNLFRSFKLRSKFVISENWKADTEIDLIFKRVLVSVEW